MRQLAESGQSKSARCSGGVTSTKSHPCRQSSISTTTSHKAKRDDAQLRVLTHEYADAMRVPEQYASSLRTRTLQSIISRMMSKCRTRQLESCRYVICALLCLAQEGRASEVSKRSKIERWLALAAGESVLSFESRSEHPVVIRRRPHGDRREVR